MNNLKLSTTPDPQDVTGIPYAEEMRFDEGGVDLLIDGETELSASFNGLDNFELAYRLMPEDFSVSEHTESHYKFEVDLANNFMGEEELEASIVAFLTELANRRGYGK